MIVLMDSGNSFVKIIFCNNNIQINKLIIPSSKIQNEIFLLSTVKEFIKSNINICSYYSNDQKKGISWKSIICSVTPDKNKFYSSVFKTLFLLYPIFLNKDNCLNLKIQYKHVEKLGPDRIANAMAVSNLYPKKNIIVIDMGTAINIDVVTADKGFIGGAILSGIDTTLSALSQKGAMLPEIKFKKPNLALGTSTIECIESGIFYGTIGAIKELIIKYKDYLHNSLPKRKTIVIGSGGFAHFFKDENIFDNIEKNLIIHALKLISKY